LFDAVIYPYIVYKHKVSTYGCSLKNFDICYDSLSTSPNIFK